MEYLQPQANRRARTVSDRGLDGIQLGMDASAFYLTHWPIDQVNSIITDQDFVEMNSRGNA